MKIKLLFVFWLCLAPTLGCGQSSSDLHAPAGNELQKYAAEHPEVNEVNEPTGE